MMSLALRWRVDVCQRGRAVRHQPRRLDAGLCRLILDGGSPSFLFLPPPFSLPLGLGEEPDLLCAASLLKLWHQRTGACCFCVCYALFCCTDVWPITLPPTPAQCRLPLLNASCPCSMLPAPASSRCSMTTTCEVWCTTKCSWLDSPAAGATAGAAAWRTSSGKPAWVSPVRCRAGSLHAAGERGSGDGVLPSQSPRFPLTATFPVYLDYSALAAPPAHSHTRTLCTCVPFTCRPMYLHLCAPILRRPPPHTHTLLLPLPS